MTGPAGEWLLLTVAPMLPLRVAGPLFGGIARGAAAAGCTKVRFGPGLDVWGVLPGAGSTPDFHTITVLDGGWRCSCLDQGLSYGVRGDMLDDAVRHVPAGDRWMMEPGGR